MMPLTKRGRRAVTLVELLVVMSILVGLTALALMLLPQVTNQDRTLKATADVQSTYRIAQGMAGTARLPRGVRLIVPPGSYIATEMLYLESPPIMITDSRVLVADLATDPTGLQAANRSRVEFSYELYNGSETSIDPERPGRPARGTIKRRHCYIVGLTPDQETQVAPGATLVMPVLGAWSRIDRVIPANSTTPLEAILNVYPDVALGVETTYRTYHFGIYGPPVPLIGEPLIQLPQNIGIDLQVSYPPGQPGQNYDILFAPSGQTMLSSNVTANTNVFLWVRDTTKVTNMLPLTTTPLLSYDPAKFRQGGEQQIIGIRNGYVGTAPVLWPAADGTFSGTDTPFTLAQNKLN